MCFDYFEHLAAFCSFLANSRDSELEVRVIYLSVSCEIVLGVAILFSVDRSPREH